MLVDGADPEPLEEVSDPEPELEPVEDSVLVTALVSVVRVPETVVVIMVVPVEVETESVMALVSVVRVPETEVVIVVDSVALPVMVPVLMALVSVVRVPSTLVVMVV